MTTQTDFSIYDFDDALMHMPETGVHRLWSKARSCTTAVAGASRVIAGSQMLAEWASTLNRDVVLIPTCIEPEDYGQRFEPEPAGPPRLVWIGSASTERFLWHVREPLERLHRETGATLTIIGGPEPKQPVLSGPYVLRRPWQRGVERYLCEYDIGVAPLDDGLFQQGKCAYKLLQYAAAGLPVVASPVGANAKAIDDLGLMGATGARQWLDALLELSTATPAQRRSAGAEARRRVERHYSYGAWEAAWLDAVSGP